MIVHDLILAVIVIMFLVFGATLFGVQLYVMMGRQSPRRALAQRSADAPMGGVAARS